MHQQHQNMKLLCNTIPLHLHIKVFNKTFKIILKHLSIYVWYPPVGKILHVFFSVRVVFLTYFFQFIVRVWILELVRWPNLRIYVNVYGILSNSCLWGYKCITTNFLREEGLSQKHKRINIRSIFWMPNNNYLPNRLM